MTLLLIGLFTMLVLTSGQVILLGSLVKGHEQIIKDLKDTNQVLKKRFKDQAQELSQYRKLKETHPEFFI